ncbi:TPA: hypothetical protein ACXM9F_007298, partial [Burkholderia cenocepacia]
IRRAAAISTGRAVPAMPPIIVGISFRCSAPPLSALSSLGGAAALLSRRPASVGRSCHLPAQTYARRFVVFIPSNPARQPRSGDCTCMRFKIGN